MNSQGARALVTLIVGVTSTLLFAAPAAGAERELIVRASITQMMPDLSYQASTDNGWPIDVSSSSDTGWSLDFEVATTRRLGVAFQFAKASPEARFEVDPRPVFSTLEARDHLDVTMYAASVNLHLTPDRAIDMYVRPVVAYMSFGDLTFAFNGPDGLNDTLHFDVGHEVTWGIGMGADIPLGASGWLATASATYLDSTLEIRQIDEQGTEMIGFDPLLVSVGIGYRF